MTDKRQVWRLDRTAQRYGQRPSSLLRIRDPFTALQLDNAVAFAGSVIESAAQETHNVGTDREPKYELRYQMDQLLDPQFKLPAPLTAKQREERIKAIKRAQLIALMPKVNRPR